MEGEGNGDKMWHNVRRLGGSMENRRGGRSTVVLVN